MSSHSIIIKMHYVHCEGRPIFLIIFRRVLQLKSRTMFLPCDSQKYDGMALSTQKQ
jgi:hypothetical protein